MSYQSRCAHRFRLQSWTRCRAAPSHTTTPGVARLGILVLALSPMGLVHAQQAAGSATPPPVASASAAQSLAPVMVQGVAYGANAVALPSTISILGQRALTQGQPQV
ncbi:MAG: hypothetical protein WCA24_06790, partial [Thiomonas sp.]